MTAGKSSLIRYAMPRPALEAALHAQPIIWYFAASFGRCLSFACALHMYTPPGGKAPSVALDASPCSSWEPQGAASARWCSARVSVCWPVVCRIVPCGWRVGAAVRCLAVRVARRVPWCRGVPSGSAGWVRLNTPVPACTSRRARGSRGASPRAPACPCWGSGGKEYWSVSQPPLAP